MFVEHVTKRIPDIRSVAVVFYGIRQQPLTLSMRNISLLFRNKT